MSLHTGSAAEWIQIAARVASQVIVRPVAAKYYPCSVTYLQRGCYKEMNACVRRCFASLKSRAGRRTLTLRLHWNGATQGTGWPATSETMSSLRHSCERKSVNNLREARGVDRKLTDWLSGGGAPVSAEE